MRVLFITFVSTLLLSIYGFSANADESSADTKSQQIHSESTDKVAIAHLANQLARYGDENKDVLAMITAARMHNRIGTHEEKFEKQVIKQVIKGDVTSATSRTPIVNSNVDFSPRGLLERAKEYAGTRQDLIALIKDEVANIPRGRQEGPTHYETTVGGFEIDLILVNLKAHEAARISVTGDGKSELDLGLCDEKGNLLCDSSNSGDIETCLITPAYEGHFYVHVKNLGRSSNSYQMVTN
jgi:hypothetical protein